METIHFHRKEMPMAGSYYYYLVFTTMDSAAEKYRNFYRQAILKQCKYIEKDVMRHTMKDGDICPATLMKYTLKVYKIMCF